MPADNAGAFLNSGGAAFYHSPMQPEPLRSGCRGWGTFGNFVADENLKVKQYTSQYFASQMINLEWVKHGAGAHRMFPAASDVRDESGNVLVTAYALLRQDGEWSLMLVNSDASNPHPVKVEFDDSESHRPGHFTGRVTEVTFGAEQYVWHPMGRASHAAPYGPPLSETVQGGEGATYTLPRASITVLRGRVEGLDPIASR